MGAAIVVFGFREEDAVVRMGDRRHFPPPWSVEEKPACFIVRDNDGQALAHVYFEDAGGERPEAKLPSKGDARRIAARVAKLPGLLHKA
jgi:hypothetical protein